MHTLRFLIVAQVSYFFFENNSYVYSIFTWIKKNPTYIFISLCYELGGKISTYTFIPTYTTIRNRRVGKFALRISQQRILNQVLETYIFANGTC